MRQRVAVIVSACVLLGLLACGDSNDRRPTGPDSGDGGTVEVTFADSALEAAVREAPGAPGLIAAGNLDGLTTLTAPQRSIESLEGIEQLRGLKVLDLADNAIVDISPLAGLHSLSFLDLTGNQVSGLSPLAGLQELTTLLLASNQVTDISPLLSLERLATLKLTGNPLPVETREAHLAALSARGVDVSFHAEPGEAGPGPVVKPDFGQFTYAFNGKARIGRRFIIWIGATDSSPPWPLIDENADFIDFDWSSDGSRMVFRSNREDDLKEWYKTYLVNADGSGLEAISDFAQHDLGFTWSPDGAQIAFISNRDMRLKRSGGDVFVMDADGSNVTKLTPSDGLCYSPSWAPDGSVIAYSSDRSGLFSIHMVDPTGVYDLNMTAGEPPISGASSVAVKWQPR